MNGTEYSIDERDGGRPRAPLGESTWWWLSGAATLALLVVLCGLWWSMNHHDVDIKYQVIDTDSLDASLAVWEKAEGRNHERTVRIPTGLFIQSMKFLNASEVSLTGYLWQRYTDSVHYQFAPPAGEVGFVLPEQVDSGGDADPVEIYRIEKDGKPKAIGWYFEATLRQPFDYSDYPFDHKTVWVRLWPQSFSGNVVLVPDFDSYDSTECDAEFGIDKDIVLGTWNRDNTYFDYAFSSYDTNFGIDDYVGRSGFPELRYNVVINRNSANAFIVYLLPLFLVAALLFGTLLIVTARPKLVERHGFSTSGVLGTCSALFFVVLLAHVQLREQFAGSGVVYLERFYLLMYVALVLAAINTYLFSVEAGRRLAIIHYRDNLFPKLLFWPVLLAGMVVVTAVTMARGGDVKTSATVSEERVAPPHPC